MNIKDLFNFNYPFFRIKLDDEQIENTFAQETEIEFDSDKKKEFSFRNEWHQEYELIYSSYVLEK